MGLLRDTYIINQKTDTSIIEAQLRKHNDIQEEQNKIVNNTRDRVNISLKEYEELKEDLYRTKQLLNSYEEFVRDLAKGIKHSPEILLKAKVIKSEMERVPYKMNNYNIYVVWEIDDLESEVK